MAQSSRSLARELALLILGQISDKATAHDLTLEDLLLAALAALHGHMRDALERSAQDLHTAQQHGLESELESLELSTARDNLRLGLEKAEQVINRLSAVLDLPRLLLAADQEQVRSRCLVLAAAVKDHRATLDRQLDDVMEGWRLARLPQVDRNILRLAAAELMVLDTPVAVVCNEAVALANTYSDMEGRRRINGILRRLTVARLSPSGV
ncbi:MAG TPA: transcription antitermination factor NusB [Synechococcus sp. UBA8638]|uniref:transcription antitermination factor NusB n=1 Tax=Candidatus Synechococcus spongiarum TaxID=431041 RepID=UPI00046F99B8|nr:transcription antitermination factor NusB [Candidatus Synechococcus spongiarum]HBP53702.1 transcription antitermination factor NusB [Synechococcus sp. UBA8638]